MRKFNVFVLFLAALTMLFCGNKISGKNAGEGKASAMSDVAAADYEEMGDMDASVKIPISATIPDLSGLTSVEAKKMAEQYKFVVGGITEEYSDTVKKGETLKQTPAKNANADIGTAVKIVISKGVELISVPKLTGISADKAKKSLSNNKLKFKVKEKYSTVKKGNVITQSVKAGKKVKKGTTVTISVSKGEKPVSKPKVNYDTPAPTSRPAPTRRPVATPKPAPTKKPSSNKPKSDDDFDISDW